MNSDESKRLASSMLVAVAVAFASPLSSANELAENQARFGEITGTVEVLSQGAVEWVEAHKDLPLETGDQIRVGEESQAELSIAPNVLWVAGGETELIVGHTTEKEGRISMRRGVLSGKVEPLAGRLGSWNFETPAGVCGVRGTEFILTHSDEEGTELAVAKGIVELQPAESAEGNVPPVLIGAGEQGILKKRMPLRKLTRFTPAMQARVRHLPRIQKRFRDTAGVWSPLTHAYRVELRRKFIAPPPKIRRRPAAVPRKRSEAGKERR
jgi:hypothetical protein